MLTDPIADYLTRVRNALRADHPEVEIPASRLKKEMTRILVEQGYLNGFEVEPTSVGESIRINLKYTEDRDPVINGMKRISRPGRRRYVASTTVPRVQGGDGHCDHLHLDRRDDRSPGQGAGRRRRSDRLRLVAGPPGTEDNHEPNGNKPVEIPAGVTVDVALGA